MTPSFARTLNALGLLALSGALGMAFLDQFVKGELPCPLCLLQRAGMVIAGIGIAMNLTIGPRPAHYAMAIIAAVAGAAVSLRQIALHIVPGTGSYGDALWGLHFYTWAFVVFALIILGSAAMMLFEGQFAGRNFEDPEPWDRPRLTGLSLIAFVLFTLLTLGNAVSTYAECELGLCPENPTTYQLFEPKTGAD